MQEHRSLLSSNLNLSLPRFDEIDWTAHAFVNEYEDDAEVVKRLKLPQPLDTITLKAPQLLAYYYGINDPFFILGFDKGMGKTITYLLIAHYKWLEAQQSGRPIKVVILCSTNAMYTQTKEIMKYFPDWANRWTYVRTQGKDRESRRRIWEADFDVFIATPATWANDHGFLARGGECVVPRVFQDCFLIVDEHHKSLRTRKSKFFELVKKQRPLLSGFIPSSGSAGGKGPQDVWAALRVVKPKQFTAYWTYVYQFCEVNESRWGKVIGPVRNIAAWRKAVSTAVVSRKKDLKDYPPKTRQALPYEMPAWQKKVHDSLRKELIAEIEGEFLITSNVLAATMALRRFMVCPKTLNKNWGYGGGLEAILADIQDSELTHFVISTPFRSPIPDIEDFFALNKFHTERLMGSDGIDPQELQKRIERWTKNGGLLAQTIDYATSYELPAAQNMYMLGYKHNPEDNAQAEDRIHRDIRVTPYPVNIYYVKAVGSYDETIIEMMADNADNAYNMLHRPLSEVFKLYEDR